MLKQHRRIRPANEKPTQGQRMAFYLILAFIIGGLAATIASGLLSP